MFCQSGFRLICTEAPTAHGIARYLSRNKHEAAPNEIPCRVGCPDQRRPFTGPRWSRFPRTLCGFVRGRNSERVIGHAACAQPSLSQPQQKGLPPRSRSRCRPIHGYRIFIPAIEAPEKWLVRRGIIDGNVFSPVGTEALSPAANGTKATQEKRAGSPVDEALAKPTGGLEHWSDAVC